MNDIVRLYTLYGPTLWKYIPETIPDNERLNARYCMWFPENARRFGVGTTLLWFAETLKAYFERHPPNTEWLSVYHTVLRLEDEHFGNNADETRMDDGSTQPVRNESGS